MKVIREQTKMEGMLRSKESTSVDDILILDTLGELRSVYKYVNVAFIGATLSTSILKGGHNVHEPLNRQVELVVHGPFLDEQDEAIACSLRMGDTAADIAKLVNSAISPLKSECKAEEIAEYSGPVLEKVYREVQRVMHGSQ